MPAFTSFLNLYKPGGGSSGLILPDEVVDIDRINNNMDAIDSFASSWGLASRQTRDFTGPAASIGTYVPTPRLGDTYQETDGDKRLWKYDGTIWASAEGGMYLLRPKSTDLVNATIDPDGAIRPSGSSNILSVNSLFTTRFKEFDIECYFTLASAAGVSLRLRSAGADQQGNAYTDSRIYTVANGAAQASELTTSGIELSGASTTTHFASLKLLNPAQTTAPLGKQITGLIRGIGVSSYSAVLFTHLNGFDTTSYDGFTAFTYSPTGINFTVNSWIKIYGLA